MIFVSGGYRGIDRVEKMDLGVNGEMLLEESDLEFLYNGLTKVD